MLQPFSYAMIYRLLPEEREEVLLSLLLLPERVELLLRLELSSRRSTRVRVLLFV